MKSKRPNPNNLRTKNEWIRKAGGTTIQFVMQLMRLRFPGLTSNFKMVLLSIMDKVRDGGEGGAFPTLDYVSEDASIGRSTVKRALKYWRDHGVLMWAPKHGLHSNDYTLLKSPLDLRVSVTVVVDGQRSKMNLAKGPNWTFEQVQNGPLRESNRKGQRVSRRNSVATEFATTSLTGVTDVEGYDRGSRVAPHPPIPLAPLPPTGLETPQDRLEGVGTAQDTSTGVLTRPVAACEAGRGGVPVDVQASESRFELEGDMSWRYGGKVSMGPAATTPKAMDLIEVTQADLAADEEQETKTKKSRKPAFRVWGLMQSKAKERLGVDLPGLLVWEVKLLQELIDTEGYGLAVVEQMVDTVTERWASVKEILKLKEPHPTLNTLRFRASQLRDPKNFIGKGANWASPDVGDAARKAAEIRKVQLKAELEARKQKNDGKEAV